MWIFCTIRQNYKSSVHSRHRDKICWLVISWTFPPSDQMHRPLCVCVCVCPNVAWHPCALFNKQRVCVCVVRLWVAALCPSWSAARHLAVIVYSAILTVKKLQDNISGSPTRPTVRHSFPGRAGRVCVCVCVDRDPVLEVLVSCKRRMSGRLMNPQKSCTKKQKASSHTSCA